MLGKCRPCCSAGGERLLHIPVFYGYGYLYFSIGFGGGFRTELGWDGVLSAWLSLVLGWLGCLELN